MQQKRRDFPSFRDELWLCAVGEVKRAFAHGECGGVPPRFAKPLVECCRNRSVTGLSVAELWARWRPPLDQLGHDRDEVYLGEFPDIWATTARPRKAKSEEGLYTDYCRYWVPRHSPYIMAPPAVADIPTAASPFPVDASEVEQLDLAIQALAGSPSRQSSRARRFL